MTATQPVLFRWRKGAMHPVHGQSSLIAKEQYREGMVYRLTEAKDASGATRGHYFAVLKKAWDNLPEWWPEFPTVEHLRKRALIIKGYCDQVEFAAASNEDALRLAAFVTRRDDFAVVSVTCTVVSVFTAKSQSKAAMGALAFQQSKDAVLHYCADLLNVSVEELSTS